jgi:GDSL-like Lipase/Acylhydrolase family
MKPHLALLGDSILDNSPYVAPEPDTAAHLQRSLGSAWVVDLLARDGSTVADLQFQIGELRQPDIAVLSIGGNDAMDHIELLEPRATTTRELLDRLQTLAEEFGASHRRALEAIRSRVQRLVVCTIYEPPLTDPETARLSRVPLTLLNDQIVRAATALRLDILDLRSVCTFASDFVREIEPSPVGARKIAAAIEALVRGDTPQSGGRIFTG